MSRNREGQLFVGRLNRNTRVRDLEEVFETYGRLIRCDIKYGGMCGCAHAAGFCSQALNTVFFISLFVSTRD